MQVHSGQHQKKEHVINTDEKIVLYTTSGELASLLGPTAIIYLYTDYSLLKGQGIRNL